MGFGLRKASVCALGATLALASIAHAAPRVSSDNEFLVRFAERTTLAQAKAKLAAKNVEVVETLIPSMNLFLARPMSTGRSAISAMRSLNRTDSVAWAQEDHEVTQRALPNDSEFKKQWHLKNPNGDADIRAEAAWRVVTGHREGTKEEVVVAVVDGGVDVKHPDLQGNIWVNKGETADDGDDNDDNGYVDDVNGWNAYNDTGEMVADRHGTHVAGIIGARGNNGKITSGVNWRVKIMPVLASSRKTSVIAKGYGYIIKMKQLWIESGGTKGANIVSTNSSFGVDYADCASGDYPLWNDLYNEMGEVGILSAVATANMAIDVDAKGDVPSGCSSEFLITVTNTDDQDKLNNGAAWGKNTIQIGAPGTKVWSLLPNNKSGALTGTSMATPVIAGAVALMHSAGSPTFKTLRDSDPAEAARQLKALMMSTVDPLESLESTVSGGRLNLAQAVEAMVGSDGSTFSVPMALLEMMRL